MIRSLLVIITNPFYIFLMITYKRVDLIYMLDMVSLKVDICYLI